MPINKETIISVFDDKLTLMQWLKTINKALEDAVLTGVEITKKGNATLSFKFTFEDGTFLESNDIVLQQGESVNGAYIQNGHLYLTLTNGTNLDAGNVKPVSNFAINNNQHLIVNYADGTSQDLGAIFQGNVNISGTLNATAITGDSIIETMPSAYYFVKPADEANFNVEFLYAGAVKNGNKLTVVLALNLTLLGTAQPYSKYLGQLHCPQAVMDKLVPTSIGGNDYLALTPTKAMQDGANGVDGIARYRKDAVNNYILFHYYFDSNFTPNVTRYVRLEQTFLLANNLIH